MLDIAFGGALAALRERFPDPDPERLDAIEKELDAAASHGSRVALARALQSFEKAKQSYTELFEPLRKALEAR